MNEEFAIKLKTILDESSIGAVKQQLAELKEELSGKMAEVIAPAGGTAEVIDLSGTTEHAKEIEQILNRIGDLQTTLSAADALGLSSREILDIEVEIEKLYAKLRKLQSSGSGFSIIQKTTVNIKNDLKQATRFAARMIGSLIGVAGIYGTIRKAMSVYLSQNEELQNRLNGAWYALGSMFAPLLEYIVSLFVQLVSLVDAFVRYLGFAGANMSKYGKSAKSAAAAQKQLAGFDELNNVNKNAGGALTPDFNLSPVSDESLNKFKKILEIVGAIGAGLLAWKVADAVTRLFGLELEPSRLLGIALAVGGIVLAIEGLLDYLNDPSWLNFGQIIAGIGIAILGFGLAFTNTGLIIAGAVVAILGVLAAFWPQITAGIDFVVEWIDSHLSDLRNFLVWMFGDVGRALADNFDFAWEIVKGFIRGAQQLLDGLFKGVKQVLDGIIQIFRGDFAGGLQTIWQGILTFGKGIINAGIAIINGFLGAISRSINNMIDIINSLTISIPSWVPHIGGSRLGFNLRHVGTYQIPMLASGTDYVPNDMLAQLHEGEAVIPKEFNSEEYFSNDETNDLLRQLIEVVDSKEFRTYISQSDIGKSAVKYINSQSRIMGGSIV